MVRIVANLLGVLFSLGLAGGFGYFAFKPEPMAIPPAPEPPPATFAVEPFVTDLGVTRQNQLLTATATVVNRLPDAVVITMIAKSCSCADAEVEPKHLEPGQTATMKVSWRTGGKRGPVSDRLTVIAMTKGERPQQVFAQFRLVADVQPDANIEPSKITFTEGQPGTATLSVKPGLLPEAALKDAYGNMRGLKAIADVTAKTVTVTYNPAELPSDTGALAVMIATNSPNEPWITIPVVLMKTPVQGDGK